MALKQLNAHNWDEPDETSGVFGRLSPLGGVVQMNGNDWAHQFLEVELGRSVPDEVQDLFAVARGTLLYGWFYYPLYALGEQQLHRVADSAVAHRYRSLNGPLTKSGFPPSLARRIQWLTMESVIPAAASPRWDAIRDLRNIGSHADFQMLHTPGEALSSLKVVAQAVSALFDSPP